MDGIFSIKTCVFIQLFGLHGHIFFSVQNLLAFMGCLSRDKCLDMGKEIFYPKIIYLAFKANGNPVSDAKLLPTLKSVDFH